MSEDKSLLSSFDRLALPAAPASSVESYYDVAKANRQRFLNAWSLPCEIPPGLPLSIAQEGWEVMPSRLGPWLVRRRLGSGGMAIVYEAEHETTGQRAALKVAWPIQLLEGRGRDRFRREAQTHAAIQHPNLVRLLDWRDLADGYPYLALELLTGRTLAAALGEIVRLPLPDRLQRVFEIAIDVAAALGVLHVAGVVHRDVKPSNMMLCDDGTTKLLDFGLVRPHLDDPAATPMTGAGATLGTPAYMAPEQWNTAERATEAADLYSLGVILFEAITGELPAPTAFALIEQRLRHPETLRLGYALRISVPEPLEEMVAELLAFDPRNRPLRAWAVIERLRAIEPALAERIDLVADARRMQYLRDPPIAGREQELARLDDVVRKLCAWDSAGAVVLIVGEAGIGKSRLVRELRGQLASRHAPVSVLKCQAQSSSALIAWLGTLIETVRTRDDAAALVAGIGRVLAQRESRFLELPGVAEQPEPADLGSENAARQTRAIAELLTRLHPRGAALIVEDLHEADERTLDFLAELVRTGWHERSLIVVTYRPEELGREQRRLVSELGRHQPIAFDLAPLDEDGTARLLHGLLGTRTPPAALAAHFLREGRGHPFWIAETVRLLQAQGYLGVDDTGSWDLAQKDLSDLPLTPPAHIAEVIAERLERLADGFGRALIKVAHAAAVLAHDFDEALLAAVARLDEDEATEAIDELARCRFLVPAADASAWDWCHDLQRAAVYERLGEGRRRRLHQRAADVLSTRPSRPLAISPATIAFHYHHAGNTAGAIPWYEKAATEAVARFAYSEAETYFATYFDLSEGPSAQSVAVRLCRAERLLLMCGRFEEAQSEYRLAVHEAEAIEPADVALHARALKGLAASLRMAGRVEDSRAALDQALVLMKQAQDAKGELNVHLQHAIIEWERENLREACRIYRSAVVIAQDLGLSKIEAQALNGLGWALFEIEDWTEARAILARALELTEKYHMREGRGIVMGNIACLYQALGDFDKARRLHEQALAMDREIGQTWSQGITIGSLAMIATWQERWQDARDLAKSALAIHQRVGDRRHESAAHAFLLWIDACRGENGDVCDEMHRIAVMQREIGHRRGELMTLRFLATCKRRLEGALSQASEIIATAYDIASHLHKRSIAAVCVAERGHIALARGESAIAYIEEASDLARGSDSRWPFELSKAIDNLTAAQASFTAQKPLLMGECPERIPAGLRCALKRIDVEKPS